MLPTWPTIPAVWSRPLGWKDKNGHEAIDEKEVRIVGFTYAEVHQAVFHLRDGTLRAAPLHQLRIEIC